MKRILFGLVAAALVMTTPGCGGGGGGSTSSVGSGGGSTSSPSSPAIQITTNSILPGALQNHPYSATLAVTNAQGAVTWSIAPVAPTVLYVEGLSINPTTGEISGNPTYQGSAGFIAKVTDSANRTTTKSMSITSSGALTAAAVYDTTVFLYGSGLISPQFTGGVAPFTISMPGLPPGFRFNATTNRAEGVALQPGLYTIAATVRDSYTTPEVVSQTIHVNVPAPPLQLLGSLPQQIPLNAPFSGVAAARGGAAPYVFTLTGTIPPGTTFNTNTGELTGTPNQLGFFTFHVLVTDSTTPAHQTASWDYGITVANPLDRNDTVATATPLGNGFYQATLSPYIDPPDKAPLPADGDYYRLSSIAGTTVSVKTTAKEFSPTVPTDTVLEIVDVNGVRLNTCRPAGSTAAFTSACLNDDVSATLQDSAIEIKMPGTPSEPSRVYVHVVDWRGLARPEMQYSIILGGIVTPMTIPAQTVTPAALNRPQYYQLVANNAQGSTTWSITSGALPPGITMTSTGYISGTATSLGTYPFTVQVTDSGTPQQTVTANLQMQVVDLLTVSSPATWPDACLHQAYSFTMTASGGAPPYHFALNSMMWPALQVNYDTGIVTGTAAGLDTPGTFTANVSVSDQTGNGVIQTVQVTVRTCP